MGGGGSKEGKSKQVFNVKKMNENERRKGLGLGPLPSGEIRKGTAKVVVGFGGFGYHNRTPERDVLMSPVVFSFDDPNRINENVFVKNLLNNVAFERNYGWLPVEVIHELLMFMAPKDLLCCMLSCRLVHRVGSTNLFWKAYYKNYYDEKTENEDMKIKDDHFNWKKQFFKRFSGVATDSTMRKTWNPMKMSVEEIQTMGTGGPMMMMMGGGENKFHFRVYGKDGVGKRSWIHQLVEDENEFVEKKDNLPVEYFFKTSPAPPNNDNNNPNILFRNGFNSISYVSKCKVMVSSEPDINDRDPSTTSSNGYFLCFSLDDPSSFEYLEKYVKALKSIEGRKDGVGHGEAPKGQHRYHVVVVGLKSDIPYHERKVKRNEIRLFVKKNNFKGYIETSAKHNCNVFLPLGVILTKSATKVAEEAPMMLTEMLPLPPTEIKYDPMLLTQQII